MKSKEEKVMRCETPAPRTATRCGPCSPSERNRYFRGKKLTVADFEVEQDYLIERRRLINRTMLGWGVAEGFAITPGEAGITVRPGMAFDARGRELVACEPVDLTAPDDLLWLIRGGMRLDRRRAPVRARGRQAGEGREGLHRGDGTASPLPAPRPLCRSMDRRHPC
jgi:hypothetical protein